MGAGPVQSVMADFPELWSIARENDDKEAKRLILVIRFFVICCVVLIVFRFLS